MENQLKLSYENIGSSSYLTITFPPGISVIHYQLEMLVSNEISYLLPVSRRIVNGETVVYYNISSRITLAQIMDRRKLKRKEFISLAEAAVKACQEVGEYQMGAEGLFMDPEYIYVDPSDCSPAFLYLPAQSFGMPGLRELMMNLIMQGRLEMSNDNLIQMLLETINSSTFSPELLEECLKKYKNTLQTPVSNRQAAPAVPQLAPVFQAKTPESSGILQSQPIIVQEEKKEIREFELPEDNKKTNKKSDKKKVKKKDKKLPEQNEDTGDFDSEKAKKKFLLPQAAVMVVLAALVSFGAFTDETGAVVINNILAVVIILGIAEVILYREIYINSRKEEGKKKKNSSKKSETKKPENTKGVQRPKPPMPLGAGIQDEVNTGESRRSTTSVMRQVTGMRSEPEAQPVSAVRRPEPMMKPSVGVAPMMQPSVGAVPVMGTETGRQNGFSLYENVSEADFAGETELWEPGEEGMSAYLEYYENGIMTRIPLDKPSVLIGRLQSQVDFAVLSPKVGKVHAEFINQAGMFYVKDLNSKNGTYINGSSQRINSNVPYPLNDNDRITLADSEFTLRCSVR